MDGSVGKIFTGNPRFSNQILGVLVKGPLSQSIVLGTTVMDITVSRSTIAVLTQYYII